jgi:exopolyphosphatase/guanosine-5'-triphosphate,3'-diphosphate pyrophosphatase
VGQILACDLGSNSLRVLLWDCDTFTRIKEYEKILNLAKDLRTNQMIDKKSIEGIIEALKESGFDFLNTPTIAIATEALRRARNKTLVVGLIKSKIGINFRIIDEKEEAFLSRLGAEFLLQNKDLDTNSYFLVDLGGGTMELTCKNGSNLYSRSFPLGVITLLANNPKRELFKRALTKGLESLKLSINSWPKPAKLILTGGTATTLSAYLHGLNYKNYDYKVVSGSNLSLKDATKALKEATLMSKDEKESLAGPKRGALVIAGIKILIETMETLGFDKAIIVDEGVREGAAIAYCGFLANKEA